MNQERREGERLEQCEPERFGPAGAYQGIGILAFRQQQKLDLDIAAAER
jgi:hypothetical protein